MRAPTRFLTPPKRERPTGGEATARARRTRILRPARGGTVTLMALSITLEVLAHTPVTTKYRFAEDVKPVLKKHCVRCHSPGGPTPMSLRTYDETRPWAESIKEQVLARNMPPVFIEHGSAPVRNGAPLTARELDILVDWASGGAPEGSAGERGARAREVDPRRSEEPSEEPGPSEDGVSVGGGAEEAPPPLEGEPPRDGDWRTYSFDDVTLPSGEEALRVTHRVELEEAIRFLRGWVVASHPSEWLRSVALWADQRAPAEGETSPGTSIFLGSWVAGDEPLLFPRGAAVRLRPGRWTVRAEARYARTWPQGPGRLTGRTRITLRVADRAPRRAVVSVSLSGESEDSRIPVDAELLAFSPSPSAPPGRLLVAPAGHVSRVILDLYRVPDEWPITYRFATPQRLAGPLVWERRGGHAGLRESGAVVGGYAMYVTESTMTNDEIPNDERMTNDQ